MRRAGLPFALLALVVSCGGGEAPNEPGDATAGTLTVYAASSLTDAFTEIGAAFDAAHPGVHTEFNFGGSPTLRTQIEQGARADVVALADEANMRAALEKVIVADAGATFVRNKLTIIVPKANPGNVGTPADLAGNGLKLILAQANVPAGQYAREAIAKMAADPAFGADFAQRVQANIVSEEPNVKAVVAKVQLGEADAGIVYHTDVTPGVDGDVTAIEIADAYNVAAAYPIAVTSEARHADAARAFIAYILSEPGQVILVKHGFLPRP